MSYPHRIGIGVGVTMEGETPIGDQRQIQPRRVGVIVAGRDHGRYLPDCLQSVKAQSMPPTEIVYVDDDSSDNSVDIAVQESVRTIPLEDHVGVCAARNIGVDQTKSDYLLFVDADNILTPEFIERQVTALEESGADFAMPNKQYFGSQTHLFDPEEWDRSSMWVMNRADTSSMIRRDTFEAVGRWDDSPTPFFDWDLFLRAGRTGRGVRSDAVLNYRSHPGMMSNTLITSQDAYGHCAGVVRSKVATMTVCCPYSGRIPSLLPAWLSAVATATLKSAELVIVDDSRRGIDRSVVEHWAGHFVDVRIERPNNAGTGSRRSRDKTSQRLAGTTNSMLSMARTEIVWMIEDDIIVPDNACDDLRRLLLYGCGPNSAVSGLYRSRHEPDKYLASRWNDETGLVDLTDRPVAPTPIDVTGFGCLMMLMPISPKSCRPYWHIPNTANDFAPAHDWNYTWQHRLAGTPVVVHPDVECLHYTNAKEYV